MYICLQDAANLPHINEEQEQPTAEAAEGQEEGKWSSVHMSNMDLVKYAFMASLSITICVMIP